MRNRSHIKKMSGPKTVPCGKPWFTISQSENMPSLSFTFCLQLARNESSNSFASWEKPYISIFLKKVSSELKSNVFARSKKIAIILLLWCKLAKTVLTSSKTAPLADFFFWNPNCSLFIIFDVYQWNPSFESEGGAQRFLRNSELQKLVDNLGYLIYRLFWKLVLHRLASF